MSSFREQQTTSTGRVQDRNPLPSRGTVGNGGPMARSAAFQPHPDRLFPADPGTRALARELYGGVRDLPIISPHGHVDAAVLLEDRSFPDPSSLLITPDHYVTFYLL